ncbi:endogenous retrovirus group K member 6 Pro protein-like [Dasypus novemcinctus]|uniref:endogenous retrovirus group K member 6 Pro protein-like n=1 Tax=Dasypus novemcinctus TaxID=9361 RepID=UPI00265DD928|nr:endogenous retrovirus group K member 6 Pro protein-like [Dasypus novemcinctus]
MWALPIQRERPSLCLRVDGRWFQGTVDSGAEVSCFPSSYASPWEVSSGPPVQGVTGAAPSKRVAHSLIWEDEEGRMGMFQPIFLEALPSVLWGRDVLHGMGATISMAPPPTPTREIPPQ